MLLLLISCRSGSRPFAEKDAALGDDGKPLDKRSASARTGAFNINVYLENSASMDGYVKGVTDFETAVYGLLGDIKISGMCDSLNLNYINKVILPQSKNAQSADIENFIEKMEPSTFKKKGGDLGVSDLKNILQTVLKTVNEKNAAILISDFVFSPGKKADAQDYLNSQGIGIKIAFAEKLKTFDLSAVLIQLQSEFDGSYYDKTDKPIRLKCKRPYYIWVFGNTSQIRTLLNSSITGNIKGGYLNKFVLQPVKTAVLPNYKILFNPRIGDFKTGELSKKIISSASVATGGRNKGWFGFNVAVDFSNSMQDPGYFSIPGNYILSNPKYQLKPEEITVKNQSLNGYTHILNLQTNELRSENLKIDLVGKTPAWVYSSTSADDSNIATDLNEQQKTFGLKYLVEGISEAFYPGSNSNIIHSITITIKK